MDEQKNNQLNSDLNLEFDTIPSIVSVMCVCGLNFPESATAFQRAAVTLAALMESVKVFVLKGALVPEVCITQIKLLSDIIYSGKEIQK